MKFPGLDIPGKTEAFLRRALDLLDSLGKGKFDLVTKTPAGRTWVLSGRDSSGSIPFLDLGLEGGDVGRTIAASWGVESYGVAYSSDAGQSIPGASAWTVIDFEDKERDPYSLVTTGATWRLTVPNGRAGLYHVSSGALFGAAVNATVQYGLFKNDALCRRLDYRLPAGGANVLFVGGAATVYLAAGDFVDVRIAKSGAAAALSAFASDAWCSIVRAPSG